LEPRAVVAYRDPTDGRYTLCSTTQTPYRLRETAANILGIPELDLRVISPDVGGGFGMKSQFYPEDVLVLWATRRLARPVKWTGERSDAISSDAHGRHQMVEAELALNGEGRILGMRSSIAVDLGAYLSASAGSAPNNALMSYSNTYVIPLIHVIVRAMFTKYGNDGLVSRHRQARRKLRHRTIDRQGGTRNGHRSDRHAAAQSHSGFRDAAQDRERFRV
jgi:carbon-monoxide dehydrogenase large subunit